MDNIKHLLEKNRERTLPEQIEFAYLTLLSHLEQFTADVIDEMDSARSQETKDKLEWVLQTHTRFLSKNIRLKRKVITDASNR